MAAGRIYWVDRCLGSNIVPAALRSARIDVRTYADLYPNDPKVQDADWIPQVAERGWVILTKDKNIRRLPVEVQALEAAQARYVCLSSASMTGEEQVACLLHHWKTIDSVVASKRAPLVVSVTRANVQWLDGDVWRVAKHKR